MSQIIAGLNGWSEAWAGLMWAVLWQSTLVFGIIALVTLWLRRSSPTVRYWLWQIVAIKLLVMPFWAVAVPMPLLTGNTRPRRPAMEPPTGPALPMPNERMPPDRFRGSGQSISGGGPEANPLLQELRAVTWRSWLLLAWAAVVTLQRPFCL